MKITLNNKPEELEGYDQLTIEELLEVKNFTFKFLAVRINGKPIRTADYGSAVVREGDNVVVMHLISGG